MKSKIELPKQITQKLYAVYGTGEFNQGQVSIETHDLYKKSNSNFSGILLAETEITIDIANTQLDLNDVKKRVLQTLEHQKQDIHAKYHMELKEVQDKIDNLLAIEYQGE